MFIQLHDLDQHKEIKDQNVFILHTQGQVPLFMSRSFADHDIHKYTSVEKRHALVYFNRQAAVQAAATNFGYTGLKLVIDRIPINGDVKDAAKRSDAIKRFAKNDARRKREPKPWK